MSNVFRTTVLVPATMVSASLSHAQSYPSKPVRIVVPASAGGAGGTVGYAAGERQPDEFRASISQ